MCEGDNFLLTHGGAFMLTLIRQGDQADAPMIVCRRPPEPAARSVVRDHLRSHYSQNGLWRPERRFARDSGSALTLPQPLGPALLPGTMRSPCVESSCARSAYASRRTSRGHGACSRKFELCDLPGDLRRVQGCSSARSAARHRTVMLGATHAARPADGPLWTPTRLDRVLLLCLRGRLPSANVCRLMRMSTLRFPALVCRGSTLWLGGSSAGRCGVVPASLHDIGSSP